MMRGRYRLAMRGLSTVALPTVALAGAAFAGRASTGGAWDASAPGAVAERRPLRGCLARLARRRCRGGRRRRGVIGAGGRRGLFSMTDRSLGACRAGRARSRRRCRPRARRDRGSGRRTPGPCPAGRAVASILTILKPTSAPCGVQQGDADGRRHDLGVAHIAHGAGHQDHPRPVRRRLGGQGLEVQTRPDVHRRPDHRIGRRRAREGPDDLHPEQTKAAKRPVR